MRIETFLEQSPLFEVSRAARKFESHLARILQDEGITFLEALVLISIFFEEPNAVKPSQLATTFSTTRGNVSHCISSLEAKGLLRRRIDPEDARGVLLILKPQGRRRAMQAIRTLDQMQKHFEKKIGVAELKAALHAIQQVEEICAGL
ncbi:MAG: MarR family winged helix-turn-helix transcriptional regulator [Acidobacteriaceae bacterium]